MHFSEERSRRVVLSLTGTIFFLYACVIVPFIKALPFATANKSLHFFVPAKGTAKLYFDNIEIHYWWIFGFIQGDINIDYASVGKGSNDWFLWRAAGYWGPMAILLGFLAFSILIADNMSILILKKPFFPFGWKLAVFLGVSGISIQWLLLFLLWISGVTNVETDTAAGTLGLEIIPGWSLLFLNFLGLLVLMWAAVQEAKAADSCSMISLESC